jgi:hypothetical protein
VQLSLILGVLLQSGKYKQSILHISLLVKIKGKPLLLKKKKIRCVTVTENVPLQPKHKSQNKSKLLTISRKVID